jgi:peptidoglycan/LPS O-acetylase OafA/YrhL
VHNEEPDLSGTAKTSQSAQLERVRPARIDDIEFLRAVAIIVVLFAHVPALLGWYGARITALQEFLVFGHGVDLFFVISGFVIARSFLQHFDRNGGNDLLTAGAPFWIRRVFRILPAAWFWLAFSLFATLFINQSGAFGIFLPNFADAIAAVLQVANLHQWACLIKESICAEGGVPNGIYWTLSLEEQFYVFFPFVMVFVPKRWLIPALCVAAALQMFLPRNGLLWAIRSDGLIVGVLLALVSEHPAYRLLEPRFLANPFLKWATLVLFVGGLLTISAPAFNIVPFHYGLLTIVLGLWVFVASFGKGYAMPSSPLRPVLMWVGSRSYALYLCHFSAFGVTREIWNALGYYRHDESDNLRYGITGAVLLYLFAEGTYRLIERPLQRRGYAYAEQLRTRLRALREGGREDAVVVPHPVLAQGPSEAPAVPAMGGDK